MSLNSAMAPKKQLVPSVKTEIGVEWKRRFVRAPSGRLIRDDDLPLGEDTPSPVPGQSRREGAPSPPPPPRPPKTPPPPPRGQRLQVIHEVSVAKGSNRRKREDDDSWLDRRLRIRRAGLANLAAPRQQPSGIPVGGSGEEVVVFHANLDLSTPQVGGQAPADDILAQFGLSKQSVAAFIDAQEIHADRRVNGFKIAIRGVGADRQPQPASPVKASQTAPPPPGLEKPSGKGKAPEGKAPEGEKPAGQNAPSQVTAQGQETDAAARKQLWLQDLESIRRDTPLAPLDSNTLVVTIKRSNTGGAKNNNGKGEAEVIDLIDDSPTKGSSIQDETLDPPSFYGQTSEKALIFQDRKNHKGKIPSYSRYENGARSTRLLIDKFRAKYKIPDDLTEEDWLDTAYGYATPYIPRKGWPRHHEEAHESVFDMDFALERYKNRIPLIKGLPLIEEVSFLRVPNYEGEPGECLWKAVAFHIYGDWRYYARVKAEHLVHFSRVLDEPTHPRFDDYQRLNQTWYTTKTSPKRGMEVIDTVANFYQVLNIPGIYAPLEMFMVPADLYGVFLVIYTMTADHEISFVTTRGSYNSRHLFILFVNDNHFQPLVPNEFLASEFTLPRITTDSTPGYPGAPSLNTKKRKDSRAHPWRKGPFKEVRPPLFVDVPPTRHARVVVKYGPGVTQDGKEQIDDI